MQVLHHADVPRGVGVAFVSDVGRPAVDGVLMTRSKHAAVLAELGQERMAVLHQVHSAHVVDVDEGFLSTQRPNADAMVTTLPGVVLCARGADCLPVAFTSSTGVVGAAHAGRVGFLAGVLPATVARMRELGALDVRAVIGPHICGRCYEVPETMRADVSALHPASFATTSWGTPAVDIAAGAIAQLEALGVPALDLGICTWEDAAWHSARRAGNDDYGSNGACVWLAAETAS